MFESFRNSVQKLYETQSPHTSKGTEISGQWVLVSVEIIALIATGIATTVAIAQEIWLMIDRQSATLADLLLMFLYLNVLAMIGQYLRTGQIKCDFLCTLPWYR